MDYYCYVAYSTAPDLDEDRWYLDSGSSAHMTGKNEFLTDIKPIKERYVQFGNKEKGIVIGLGTLNVHGMPKIRKVLLVEGLHANLISISQMCDDDNQVKFTKIGCLIENADGESLMKGIRTSNNCYIIDIHESDHQCLLSKQTELNIWHQKTGHMNVKNLLKIARQGIVRGLPMISGSADLVCGECQIRKQSKAVHKVTDRTSTSGILELFHMDLMGPMQTESLGGKRYVLVIVDDFSRYTWTKFLREKSGAVAAIVELILQLQNEKEVKLKGKRSDHG